MKKSIFFAAIGCIILIACSPLKPGKKAPQGNASQFNPADSIPYATVLTMVTHYSDAAVDHSFDSVIKQVSLRNSDLNAIFEAFHSKQNPVTRIRFLTAAYLDTDPIVERRNRKTVIVQIKIGYNSSYHYYDITSFGSDLLCPPPPGCSSFQN